MRLSEIKTRLEQLENRGDWRKVCSFLYSAWYNDKNNGTLCMLLTEETGMYLLLMENGSDPELHTHNNASMRNRRLFAGYRDTAPAYGLENCRGDKYFPWRLCALLQYAVAYLTVLGKRVPDLSAAEEVRTELLAAGKRQFPDSRLFGVLEEVGSGSRDIGDFREDGEFRREIEAFGLMNNRIDREIRSLCG